MTSGATIVELMGDPKGRPLSFVCGNSAGIEKGTLLAFGDPRTVSGTVALGSPFAGIAATEKVAGDGSTHIGCYTCGIFDIVAGMPITAGTYVMLSGSNMISGCTIGTVGSFGVALETASSGEQIEVAVGIY